MTMFDTAKIILDAYLNTYVIWIYSPFVHFYSDGNLERNVKSELLITLLNYRYFIFFLDFIMYSYLVSMQHL